MLQRSRSLNAKLIAIYLPLVGLAMIALFAILEARFFVNERDRLIESLRNLAEVQLTPLSVALWEYDSDQITKLVIDISRVPGVLRISIKDGSGDVVEQVGDFATETATPDLVVIRPVVFRSGDSRETIGELEVAGHTQIIRDELRERILVDVLILLVLIATLAAVTYLATRIAIIAPLSKLQRAIERMRPENIRAAVDAGDDAGGYQSGTEIDANDEIGALARSFETMAEELRTSHRELEHRVDERTTEVRKQTELVHLLHRLSSEANQASDFDNGLFRCLRAVCEFMGWPVGHAYVPKPGTPNTLTSSGVFYTTAEDEFTALRAVTEATDFEVGSGIPGQVYQTGEPIWIQDASAYSESARGSQAAEEGIRSGFVVPVRIKSRIVAVLEFFTLEYMRADDELMQTLMSVGEQLGHVAERDRADRELHEKMDELESFNRVAVGRELRMIELKREINKASSKLGGAPVYEIVE